jgi:hypothetical protein
VRVLRALAGVLLWIVAALVGLIGALLSVTLILLPVGIPLLFLAKKLFTTSVQLMMPRKLAHPVKELGKQSRKKGRAAKDAGADVSKKLRKAGRRHKSRLSLS